MLEDLRAAVWEANRALAENGLVRWTSGNASGRDPDTGLVVIKPSGVLFDRLTPENLKGDVVEGSLKPSVDTASHLYVYRRMGDINGIVHTHSPYATSFAVRGESLKIYTTTSAAVFGGDIPVSDFATIGEEAIGREIVEKIGTSPAILMRSHGVFTLGADASSALKTAVILEETAETVHFAMLRGAIAPLPDAVVKAGYEVYHRSYGQRRQGH